MDGYVFDHVSVEGFFDGLHLFVLDDIDALKSFFIKMTLNCDSLV